MHLEIIIANHTRYNMNIESENVTFEDQLNVLADHFFLTKSIYNTTNEPAKSLPFTSERIFQKHRGRRAAER